MRTENEILEKIEEYNKKSANAFDKYMNAAKTAISHMPNIVILFIENLRIFRYNWNGF